MVQRLVCSGLFALLVCSASVCAGQFAPEITPVVEPEHGIMRSLPDGDGVVYVGVGDRPDAFSFHVTDAAGISWIEVEVDPVWNEKRVSCVTWDGPTVTGFSSYVLLGSSKKDDNATPTTPVAPPEGGGYVVIIHVDQPGEGGDRDPWEGSLLNPDVGHAFIEVIDGNTGESMTVGFYPSRFVTPVNSTAPGDVRDDSGRVSDVVYEIPISEEQYEGLVTAIERDRQNPPVYDLNENNCTDYVIQILGEIGIPIESRTGTWPGGGGHNPGDFGEDLVEIGGQRQ